MTRAPRVPLTVVDADLDDDVVDEMEPAVEAEVDVDAGGVITTHDVADNDVDTDVADDVDDDVHVEDIDDNGTEDGESTASIPAAPVVRRGTRQRQRSVQLMYDQLGIPHYRSAQGLYLDAHTFGDCRTDSNDDERQAVHAEAYSTEPTTYLEAIRGDECEKWRMAMEEELASIRENATYTPMKAPPGVKTVRSKWVYKIKKNPDGTTRYKARLVAKGFTQKYGVDYLETFAPVVKYKSLRMLLALANELRWTVHQMDVTTAFLYGDIDKEIYLLPPEGGVPRGEEGLVWKLNKSLYGRTQTGATHLERANQLVPCHC